MSVYDDINKVYESLINGSAILPRENVATIYKKADTRPTPVSWPDLADAISQIELSNKVAEIEEQGDKIEDVLNTQLTHELSNANAYDQMSVYFDVEKRLMGFAAFFMKQAAGERDHAAKLLQFMKDCGLKAKIGTVKEPQAAFESPVATFEAALKLEKETTKAWHSIREKAIAAKDHATEVLSQWYVTEQVEELDVTDEWLTKVKMAGDNAAALLFLDAQIGK